MVTIIETNGYKDCDGNQIDGNLKNCKIIFRGKNAKLKLGKAFLSLGNNNTIIMENNCEAFFGDNFNMGRDNTFYFRSNSSFKIGNNGTITNYFRLYNRGNIVIGNNFGMRDFGEIRVLGSAKLSDWIYFQHNVLLYAPKYTSIKIGKDSGCSWYTKLMSGSGHSVYDLKHEIKLDEIDKERVLSIGKHVWIASGTTISNNVSIGDGCMVSANSNVVSGSYPANTLISGNPAKKILEDIAWDRRIDLGYAEYIEYKNEGIDLIERAAYLEEYQDITIDENYINNQSNNTYDDSGRKI